jgi:arylsulfatase A-like enzyme
VGSTGEPSRKGFDLFFGYNCQAVAHSYFPKYLWRNSEQVLINDNPIPGAKKQPTGEVKLEDWQGKQYAPKLMIAEAEKFIEAHRENPFFLYLPFIEPHVAMHPPRESVDRFPAEWDTEPYRGQCAYLPNPRPRAAYAAMISDLDSYIGRVMQALESAGVTDRTLVVFSSDNGTTHPGQPDTHFHIGGVDPAFFNSTAGLRGYKGSVYEGGMRVPMIARLPARIRPNTVNDAPSYFADWFPTLCDAAGLDKPNGLDGDSLWSLLTSKPGDNSSAFATTRKPMIWVFPEYGGQVAVRIGDLKAVRQGLKTKTPGPWEVYDLKKDREEHDDIAGSQSAFVQQVEDVLRREVAVNKNFPLVIPGIGSR